MPTLESTGISILFAENPSSDTSSAKVNTRIWHCLQFRCLREAGNDQAICRITGNAVLARAATTDNILILQKGQEASFEQASRCGRATVSVARRGGSGSHHRGSSTTHRWCCEDLHRLQVLESAARLPEHPVSTALHGPPWKLQLHACFLEAHHTKSSGVLSEVFAGREVWLDNVWLRS